MNKNGIAEFIITKNSFFLHFSLVPRTFFFAFPIVLLGHGLLFLIRFARTNNGRKRRSRGPGGGTGKKLKANVSFMKSPDLCIVSVLRISRKVTKVPGTCGGMVRGGFLIDFFNHAEEGGGGGFQRNRFISKGLLREFEGRGKRSREGIFNLFPSDRPTASPNPVEMTNPFRRRGHSIADVSTGPARTPALVPAGTSPRRKESFRAKGPGKKRYPSDSRGPYPSRAHTHTDTHKHSPASTPGTLSSLRNPGTQRHNISICQLESRVKRPTYHITLYKIDLPSCK